MPSPETAVRCSGLVRRFGERAALAGVDLHVDEGEFVLVTGPNGAGKTTLLRVLATVLRPSEGTVSVGGHELPRAADKARPRIGYVAHGPLTYPGLTARENLELYAALYAVSGDLVARRSTGSASTTAAATPSRSSRAGCRSGSRSPAPACTGRRCSCSTSRLRASMPTAAACC